MTDLELAEFLTASLSHQGSATMTIKVGDVYKDRSGRDVRVIANDRVGGAYPIVGLRMKDGGEDVCSYATDGRWNNAEYDDFGRDLIIPPEVVETFYLRVSDDRTEVCWSARINATHTMRTYSDGNVTVEKVKP